MNTYQTMEYCLVYPVEVDPVEVDQVEVMQQLPPLYLCHLEQ